jgi:hypothetical protein
MMMAIYLIMLSMMMAAMTDYNLFTDDTSINYVFTLIQHEMVMMTLMTLLPLEAAQRKRMSLRNLTSLAQ